MTWFVSSEEHCYDDDDKSVYIPLDSEPAQVTNTVRHKLPKQRWGREWVREEMKYSKKRWSRQLLKAFITELTLQENIRTSGHCTKCEGRYSRDCGTKKGKEWHPTLS